MGDSVPARSLEICDPCRSDHHLECAGTGERACQCLVCEAQRIGDRMNYDLGGNMPRRRTPQ